MNCPTCKKPGFNKPPKGRPRKIDDKEAKRFYKSGYSLREIACMMGVSHGTVQTALKR